MRSIRDAIERADETALRAVIARWVEGGAHFTRQAQDTSRT